MNEEYAPQRGLYVAYIAKNDPKDLDKRLKKIESVSGIVGAFVISGNESDKLEVLVGHPLSADELDMMKRAFSGGEYHIAHQVLLPVRLVGPDR